MERQNSQNNFENLFRCYHCIKTAGSLLPLYPQYCARTHECKSANLVGGRLQRKKFTFVFKLSCLRMNSSCYYKIPYTRWLINNINIFLTVWRLGSPKSKQRQVQCLVRAHFLVHRPPPFHYALTWQKEPEHPLRPLL